MSKTSRNVLKTTQCYRVLDDGTYQRFYLGCMPPEERLNLPKWCQEQADTHEQLVIMDTDGKQQFFKPVDTTDTLISRMSSLIATQGQQEREA